MKRVFVMYDVDGSGTLEDDEIWNVLIDIQSQIGQDEI